jgi:hypothetical protein
MKDRNIVAIIWVSFTGFVIALLMAMAPGCVPQPCLVGSSPCPAPATCETACLHGHKLGCDWAAPTPAGATCQQVCTNANASGVPWDTAKWSSATACQ